MFITISNDTNTIIVHLVDDRWTESGHDIDPSGSHDGFQVVGPKKKSSSRSRDAENPIDARIVELKSPVCSSEIIGKEDGKGF